MHGCVQACVSVRAACSDTAFLGISALLLCLHAHRQSAKHTVRLLGQ